MNSKVTIAVIALVILGGGAWYLQNSATPPVPPPPAPAPVAEQQPVVSDTVAKEPAPTGKVDDILASLDAEQTQEGAAVTAGDTDAATALSDGAAITDLSQTYDETTL